MDSTTVGVGGDVQVSEHHSEERAPRRSQNIVRDSDYAGDHVDERTPIWNSKQRRTNISATPCLAAICLAPWYKYINVLLLFIPLGIVSNVAGWGNETAFALNFLAVIPLSGWLFDGTELSYIIASGNVKNTCYTVLDGVTPLLVSIIALTENEIGLVHSFIIGNIISHMLLGIGISLLACGIQTQYQDFNETMFSTMTSLLAVTASAFVIFYMLSAAILQSVTADPNNIIVASQATAIVILLLYVLLLLFRAKTHRSFFQIEDPVNGTTTPVLTLTPAILLKWSPICQLFKIFGAGTALFFCTRSLIRSVKGLVFAGHSTRALIGVIILPLGYNSAPFLVTAIEASRGRLDRTIHKVMGASVNNAFFVFPIVVLVGWAVSKPVSMDFQLLETSLLGVCVVVVTKIVQQGRRTYIDGAMCLTLYLIIFLTFLIYPDKIPDV